MSFTNFDLKEYDPSKYDLSQYCHLLDPETVTTEITPDNTDDAQNAKPYEEQETKLANEMQSRPLMQCQIHSLESDSFGPDLTFSYKPCGKREILFLHNLEQSQNLQWIGKWAKNSITFEDIKALFSFLQKIKDLAGVSQSATKEISILLDTYKQLAMLLPDEGRASVLLFVAFSLADIQKKITSGASLDDMKISLNTLGTALKPTRKQRSFFDRGLDLFHARLLQEFVKDVHLRDALFIEKSFAFFAQLGDCEVFSLLLKPTLIDNELVQAIGIMDEAIDKCSKEPKVSECRRILSRFIQIYQVEEFISALKPKEILKIALYLEKKLAPLVKTTREFFKKEETRLTRTFQRDPNTGDVYLLSKSHTKILETTGSYKKVTSGIGLSRDSCEQPTLIAQAVNHTLFKGIYASKRDIEDLKKEVQVHKKFNNLRGIWPLLSVCEYTKFVSDPDSWLYEEDEMSQEKRAVPKISIITPLASGDLHQVFSKKFPVPLTCYQKLLACQDLLYGISAMHSEGFIHADVKLANALFYLEESGFLKAGFIDFGFSYHVGHEPVPYPMNMGYYGSISPTPYEMLIHRPFCGDYFKVEVFALGALFYALFLKKHPSWFSILVQYEDMPGALHSQDLAGIELEIKTSIEEPLKALLAKPLKTPSEAVCSLIYSMMRLHPQDRLDAHTACNTLKDLLATYPMDEINKMV